jgi:hypothetical protein
LNRDVLPTGFEFLGVVLLSCHKRTKKTWGWQGDFFPLSATPLRGGVRKKPETSHGDCVQARFGFDRGFLGRTKNHVRLLRSISLVPTPFTREPGDSVITGLRVRSFGGILDFFVSVIGPLGDWTKVRKGFFRGGGVRRLFSSNRDKSRFYRIRKKTETSYGGCEKGRVGLLGIRRLNYPPLPSGMQALG